MWLSYMPSHKDLGASCPGFRLLVLQRKANYCCVGGTAAEDVYCCVVYDETGPSTYPAFLPNVKGSRQGPLMCAQCYIKIH